MFIFFILLFLILWAWLSSFLGAVASFMIISLVLFILCLSLSDHDKEKAIAADKEYSDMLYEWKKNNHFDDNISFDLWDIHKIVFDEKAQKVIIFKKPNTPIILQYNEILGSEIRENGQVTGGVGRALIGGVIGGGAGAIVGANTAKETIFYSLVILRNNLQNPEYTLFSTQFPDRNSSTFYQASKFANDVNSAIRIVLKRQEQDNYL